MSERRREQSLDLRDLGDGSMVGLSPEVGGSLAQAGAVCMESQQHEPGVELVVTGSIAGGYPLQWEPPDEQARRTWRNDIDATENGAAGVALLLARRLLGYVTTSRSRHGTGFDYWLGRDVDGDPIQDEVRLEVSGIRQGTSVDVDRRVREKLSQMNRAEAATSGYAIIVEFGCPTAKVATT
ncbi:MAG: hypothetical protein F4020_00635 [Gammaproteobacteria bacterium]|nr:hypothetical protein [Gammaproteobacteria bacterium]